MPEEYCLEQSKNGSSWYGKMAVCARTTLYVRRDNISIVSKTHNIHSIRSPEVIKINYTSFRCMFELVCMYRCAM